MKKLLAAALFALAGLFAPSAQAQVQTVLVASCGTAPAGLVAGILLVDRSTGALCISAAGGGSGAVTIANGADVTQGAIADTAYAGSGSATVVAALKGIYASINGSIPAGTAIIGALVANQSVNVAQFNGVTPLMGNGATGTGSPRVTIASDGTAISTTGYMSVKLDQTTDGTTNAVSAHGAVNVTPTNCGGTITAGGTAQNAHSSSATLRGMTIANLDTTEVMWVSFTSTALASDTQSYPLAPATATTFAGLSSYTTPLGFGYNTALSVVAATTGHKWACTRW